MNDFSDVGMLKDGVDRIQTAIDFLESEDIKRALIRCCKHSYGSLVTDLIHAKCAVAAVATVMEREVEENV